MFKDRVVFRERKGVSRALEPIRIAVTGTGECVGASFTAAGLAVFFARRGRKVTYTEIGDPVRMRRLMYDAIALDRRLGRENVKAVYRSIREMEPQKSLRVNLSDGISWRVITPEDVDDGLNPEPADISRMISSADGDVQIFDVSAGEKFNGCLLDMDLVVAVTDPMPSKLMRQRERIKFLKRLEASGNRVMWTVNRMNDGVSKRQIQGFLREEQILYLNDIPPEAVYTGEFRCRLPHADGKVMEVFADSFTKISQSIGI